MRRGRTRKHIARAAVVRFRPLGQRRWGVAIRISLALFALNSVAADSLDGDLPWEHVQFFHDGTVRQFRYWAPESPEEARPVLILFHDGGENLRSVFEHDRAANRVWMDLARSEGFVLVVPNGTHLRTGQGRGQDLHWNDCRPDSTWQHRRSLSDDLSFIRSVKRRVASELKIDTARIYATGAGEGGLMAMRLAFEAPDLVAAVGIVNASLPLHTDCDRSLQPIPMVVMNSTLDTRFRWNGGNAGDRHGMTLPVPRMRDLLRGYNWVRSDQAEAETLPDLDSTDGCTVERTWIPGSERGADLCLYTIHGGGHGLPSRKHGQSRHAAKRNGPQCRDMEMAEELWGFLREYSLGQRWHAPQWADGH